MAEEGLTFQLVADQRNPLEPGHHRLRHLDDVFEFQPHRPAGHVGRQLQFRQPEFVDQRKYHRHLRPQIVAQTQQQFERRTAMRDDDADLLVPVLFARK